MSNPLGIKKTLALIDSLREVVTAAVAREQALHKSRQGATFSQQKTYDIAVEEEMERHVAALEQAEGHFQELRQNREDATASRLARIKKAHERAKKQSLDRIENVKGRAIYAAQKGTLEAGREKETNLEANNAWLQQFAEHLQQSEAALHSLQKKAPTSLLSVKEINVAADEESAENPNEMLAEFNGLTHKVLAEITRYNGQPAIALFQAIPLWLWIIFLAAAAALQAPLLKAFQIQPFPPLIAAGCAGALAAVLVVVYLVGKKTTASQAESIVKGLGRLEHLFNTCQNSSASYYEKQKSRIEREAKEKVENLNRQWSTASSDAEKGRQAFQRKIEIKASRIATLHNTRSAERIARLEQEKASQLAEVEQEHEERLRQFAETRDVRSQQLHTDTDTRWQELEQHWKETLPPLFQEIAAAQSEATLQFPAWSPEFCDLWTPPEHFCECAPIGRLDVDLQSLCETLPSDPRLSLPGPAQFALPAILNYPWEGSLLIETQREGREEALAALNSAILRLLSQAPAGRMSFTILDPVGLGQSFASVMHLADYEDNLINNRIWTQPSEIEQRLSDLNKHMEKVIQMYLRNEYETIREYNEQAGNIAEKYHFLVIADFPVGFSEAALRHLANIAVSGPRCGVFTLIHWDRRQPLPHDSVLDELRKSSVCVTSSRSGFALSSTPHKGVQLVLETPPEAELTTRFLHKVGDSWKDSNRIEVPFSLIIPEPNEVWSIDTAEELRVPIGRAGATKMQYLAIGKGTRQHTLIGGKTGSGKSTLFHVIVTNLSLWCSPDQVEFYLVDFKKGVEFKCYANQHLPHARVIAIESDREFGLGVLQRVDEELKRRGDLFRKLSVQDIAAYRRTSGEPLPRTLLMIDEFQEYFVEDDRISQEANVLLDRIVRQGRAFGIHVLLGSQTLGGAYTLARATMGQMVIRIALQCNEADAQLIMDDNNPAPRLLTRPGEGIYNDMAGASEGNSPFQTVWLSEQERDTFLTKIRLRESEQGSTHPQPFVFEGNAPADLRENIALHKALENAPTTQPSSARLWLGAPNSIKGPTEAIFRRQSGNNLLVVGQGEESSLALFAAGMASLSAQYPQGMVEFILLESLPPDSQQQVFLHSLSATLAHPVTLVRPTDLAETMTRLGEELKMRSENPDNRNAPAIFVFALGIQNFKKLRQEDEYSFSSSDEAAGPAKIFTELLTDGPALGIHIIAACDSYNNVMRTIGRKPLTEFEMRLLFQMSANDSASLIDSPRAGSLGLHRALLQNSQEGTVEIFRPYGLLDSSGLEWLGTALGQRRA